MTSAFLNIFGAMLFGAAFLYLGMKVIDWWKNRRAEKEWKELVKKNPEVFKKQ